MIEFLRGRIASKEPARLVIDVGGVGLGVDVSLRTSEKVGVEGDPIDADAVRLTGENARDNAVAARVRPLQSARGPRRAEALLKLGEEIRQMLENHNRGRQGGAGGLGTPSAGSVGFEAGIDDLFGQLGQGR